METIQQKSAFRPSRGMVFIAALFVISVFIIALGRPAVGAPSHRLFASPEDALKTLIEAVQTKDDSAIDQIFGPSGKDLHSGDKVQDRAEFNELAPFPQRAPAIDEGYWGHSKDPKASFGPALCLQRNTPHPDPLPSEGRGDS